MELRECRYGAGGPVITTGHLPYCLDRPSFTSRMLFYEMGMAMSLSYLFPDTSNHPSPESGWGFSICGPDVFHFFQLHLEFTCSILTVCVAI